MSEKKYAPIVLFVFKRKSHVEQVVAALKKNTLCAESELYIYSDGARDEAEAPLVDAVREYCKQITGFRAVHLIERQENYGVEKNEIQALQEMFATYEACIILEDDIEVNSHFLEYMNRALSFYREETRVLSISAYTHIEREKKREEQQKFYFSQMISPWGWATWADRWKLFDSEVKPETIGGKAEQKRFDMDGAYPFTEMLVQQLKEQHVTWDLAWYITSFRYGKMSLTPAFSMVNNIGMDGSGVHYTDGDITSNQNRNIEMDMTYEFPEQIEIDAKMRELEKQGIGRNYRKERRKYRLKKIRTLLGGK
jgi:hypothetical protein